MITSLMKFKFPSNYLRSECEPNQQNKPFCCHVVRFYYLKLLFLGGYTSMKKTLITKTMTFTAALAFAATAFTSNAFAEVPTATGQVGGGSLFGGSIETFTPVSLTLTGKDNAASTEEVKWAIGEITDATGTGAGWTYKINVSSFVEAAPAEGQTAKTLDGAELVVSSVPSIAKATGADTSSELSTIKKAIEVGDSLSSGNGIIFTATKNGGMGSYDVGELGVKLTNVKANAYATTYKTEVTITLDSGETTLN